jgi:hypothetical protein
MVEPAHGTSKISLAFAITSGRPPRGMAMLIDPLALRTPVAGLNGGIFVKPDMTIVEEHVLAADAAKRALEVILQNKMDVWFYSGKDWLVRSQRAPCRAGAMDRQVRPDRRREFRRCAWQCRQDRGRERRSRSGRALRKGCPTARLARSKPEGLTGLPIPVILSWSTDIMHKHG